MEGIGAPTYSTGSHLACMGDNVTTSVKCLLENDAQSFIQAQFDSEFDSFVNGARPVPRKLSLIKLNMDTNTIENYK